MTIGPLNNNNEKPSLRDLRGSGETSPSMERSDRVTIGDSSTVPGILSGKISTFPGILSGPKAPALIAHRGASGLAPENTISSFREAFLQGAGVIELDVHRTKDGHLVIIHDDTVDRTTNGHGAIKDLTLQDVKQLDAGFWFGAKFAGEKVPTLEEVLDWAKGKVRIDIEIKSSSQYPGIENDIVGLLNKKNATKDVQIISFDRQCIKNVNAVAPQIETGVLLAPDPLIKTLKIGAAGGLALGAASGILMSFSPLLTAGLALAGGVLGFFALRGIGKKISLKSSLEKDADILLPYWAMLDRKWVREAQAHGTKVYAYTADSPKLVKKLLTYYGVDGIITDNPERFTDKTHNQPAILKERCLYSLSKLKGVSSATEQNRNVTIKASSPEEREMLDKLLAKKVDDISFQIDCDNPAPAKTGTQDFAIKYGSHLLSLPGVFGIAPETGSNIFNIYVEREQDQEFLSKFLNKTVEGKELNVVKSQKIMA